MKANKHSYLLDNRLNDAQKVILAIVDNNPEMTCDARTIARELFKTTQAVYPHLKKLQEFGYLNKNPDSPIFKRTSQEYSD